VAYSILVLNEADRRAERARRQTEHQAWRGRGDEDGAGRLFGGSRDSGRDQDWERGGGSGGRAPRNSVTTAAIVAFQDQLEAQRALRQRDARTFEFLLQPTREGMPSRVVLRRLHCEVLE
jgi:hypothetical protein